MFLVRGVADGQILNHEFDQAGLAADFRDRRRSNRRRASSAVYDGERNSRRDRETRSRGVQRCHRILHRRGGKAFRR